jgi:hypothetical protein
VIIEETLALPAVKDKQVAAAMDQAQQIAKTMFKKRS